MADGPATRSTSVMNQPWQSGKSEDVRVPFLKSEWICALMSHSLCHMLIPSVSRSFTRLLMRSVNIPQRRQTVIKWTKHQIHVQLYVLHITHRTQNISGLSCMPSGRHMKERNWRHSRASTISSLSLSHSHVRMHVHTNTYIQAAQVEYHLIQ